MRGGLCRQPRAGTKGLNITCGDFCFILRQGGRRFVRRGCRVGRCEEDTETTPGSLSPHSLYAIPEDKTIKPNEVDMRSEPGWVVEMQCSEAHSIISFMIL